MVYAIRSLAGRSETTVLLYRNGDPKNATHGIATNPTAPDIALPNDATHFKIVIQVANYIHKQGGIPAVPMIDSLKRLTVSCAERRLYQRH